MLGKLKPAQKIMHLMQGILSILWILSSQIKVWFDDNNLKLILKIFLFTNQDLTPFRHRHHSQVFGKISIFSETGVMD